MKTRWSATAAGLRLVYCSAPATKNPSSFLRRDAGLGEGQGENWIEPAPLSYSRSPGRGVKAAATKSGSARTHKLAARGDGIGGALSSFATSLPALSGTAALARAGWTARERPGRIQDPAAPAHELLPKNSLLAS